MVLRYMPNSDPWGPRGIPFMTIFVFYVSTQLKFPILRKMKHMKSTNPGRYIIFCLIKFPVEWCQNHVWGLIFDPSYNHFYKCDHFVMREGKKEREKGKGKREGKKGREKGKGKREGKKGKEKEEEKGKGNLFAVRKYNPKHVPTMSQRYPNP